MKPVFSAVLQARPEGLIIAASLLLSLWSIATAPLVNTDGILYLLAAESVLKEGLSAATDIYQWPLFHLLVAGIHEITRLSLLTSGHLLMAACFATLCLGFYRLVKDLGGDRYSSLFAALIILCHPIVNDFRSSLIRDPGMLAFMLLALSEHIRYVRTPSWRHAIAWGIYITTAFLFRVEALALMLLAPLATLLVHRQEPQLMAWRSTLYNVIRLFAVPLILGLSCFLFTLNYSVGSGTDNIKLFRDLTFMFDSLQKLSSGVSAQTAAISNSVLEKFSADDAIIGLLGMMFTITGINVLRAISLPYLLGLLCNRWKFFPEVTPDGVRLVKFYAVVIATYLFCFTLFAHFNLTRYCLQLGLLMLLPLPFIFARWWHEEGLWTRGMIIFLLIANAADSLINSDYKKAYIHEAALWVKESRSISPNTLITNEPHLAYFGTKASAESVIMAINPEHRPPQRKIETFWLTPYTYAFRVKNGTQENSLKEDIKNAQGKILHVFRGSDNHSLYLFTVNKNARRSRALIDSP